ncbi:MAG TPA: CdaR family protein [Bryobacteraceae bacterium]|nr:CdaR family protein [Bryobacteraceae bacterium]
MMRGIKNAAGFVLGNFWWKVLSLAAAFTIWALVATEPEMNTLTTAQLEFRNLPDSLEMSSSPVTTVRLELRGPSGALRDMGAVGEARPSIVLDMSGVEPGQRTFPIDDGAVKLPRGVRLVRAIPSEVRFDFDTRLERSVPVTVRFTGQGENGWVVDHYSVSPEVVEIIGPSSHVKRVAAAITDPVDVASLTETNETRVNLFVDDDFVRFESPTQAVVTVTMKKKKK